MNKRANSAVRRATSLLPIILGILFTLDLLRPAVASAQELNPPVIEELRVGFDSQFKIAHWTPVEITFLGGSKPVTGHVKLILPDGDGTPSVVTSPRPVQLLPGRRVKVLMYARFGESYGEMRVLLRADDKNAIDRTFDTNGGPDRIILPAGLQSNDRLIVTLGSSVGVEEAVRLHQQATGEQITVAGLRGANDLPTEWYGYDGVDWLVISTSQPQMFTQMLDTGARRAALEHWIEMGGKLLLVAGEQAPTVLAADAPLAVFAPGQFVEPTTLRRTTTLESFVGGSRKVRPPQDRELSLPVPRLANVAGRAEVADGNLPLIVRTPHRFGEVVFVGVDLDRRPLQDWDGRGSLVGRLLGLAEPGAGDKNAQVNANAARMGRNGFQSSLREGLDNFRGVTPISFAVVAAMILGYIVLIGPGDYFLVKRVLKRMELTWITFPLWVILVSGGAYALAIYTKGDDLRLNQVDLVDVDVASGWARATSWLNVFSPQSQAFDLQIEPRDALGGPVADSRRVLSWLGSANNGMAGGAGSLFSGRYDFSPTLDEMLNVPIQVWSTKGFFATSSYELDQAPTAKLTLGPDGVPEGNLRNDFDFELSQCMLVSGRWAYVLGDLKPGASVRLRPGDQRDLEHVLRRADTPQRGVVASVEDLMFFRAANGRINNTQNAESYGLIDMTHLLTLDRAILVAHVAKPAAQLLSSGKDLAGPEDQHWTMYRFVYPVSKPKSAAPAPAEQPATNDAQPATEKPPADDQPPPTDSQGKNDEQQKSDEQKQDTELKTNEQPE